jgi:fluoroquinolone resistance protein
MLLTAILFSEPEYADQVYKNITLKPGFVQKIEFIHCTFKNSQFKETKWAMCTFKDCAFQKCDFHLAQFPRCSFLDVRFEDCQLVGINWTDTSLQKKSFLKTLEYHNSVLNYSTFSGSFVPKIVIKNCIVQNADFSEANLSNSNCSGSDFAGTRFDGTNLTGADFRGARNYTIPVLRNQISKAKFSLPEALSLLSSLDLEISDKEEE